MQDRVGRTIDYMRISITDRCNLRCKYCMPHDIEKMEMSEILTFEEIRRVVEAAVSLGIRNYRITGGEPLVRRGCPELIAMLKEIDGVESVGMTTNGVLLGQQLDALKRAGLDRLNVSLDTVDPKRFQELTGRDELQAVLAGIDQAVRAGIPLKMNTVNQKGLDWKPVLDFAEKRGIPVRFIEMMPIGYGKKYIGRSNQELLKQMELEYGCESTVCEKIGSGPAVYRHFEPLPMNVGFISAMSHKFCGSCNRVRLSAKGYLKLCLCYEQGVDLRSVLRNPKENEQLGSVMEQAIFQKPIQHCFETEQDITESNAMVQIGG